MAGRPRRGVVTLLGGLVPALTAPSLQATAATPTRAPATEGTGMVMVLDSSVSIAGKDGSGSTLSRALHSARAGGAPTAAARKAVGTVVDALPDGYPTGLRVYGADKPRGCDDTRLAQPVAAQLAASGVDLHIDAIGFQVAGKARAQLECIAKAGNGRYYDAPDARSLARQLQRAGQLSADGYRFEGKQIHGAATRSGAPAMTPGYLDSIGPNEERYYATELDAASTANFSATVVPQPGAAVDYLDALHTRIAYGADSACQSTTETFGQQEGATPLTSGVSRVPSQSGTGGCDKAGRYWLVVERKAAKGSDAARWPMELTFHVEHPLKKGVTPAQSEPEYGAGGKDATLSATAPKDVTGGTGFNDARTLHQGVWRDKVLPAQTLWYKVPVGWGQQLRYDVEFANEPTVRGYGDPQAAAAAVAADTSRGDSGSSADETPGGGGGWSTGRVAAVAVGGVGVLPLAGLAVAYGRARRRPRADGGNSDPMRGGSW